MSVRKKLEKPKVEAADIEALINKGAKVKEDHIEESRNWVYINIRISPEMLKHVDKNVRAQVGIKRTGWILQAIQDKLEK